MQSNSWTQGRCPIVIAVALLLTPGTAWGQAVPATVADSLRAEIAVLRAEINNIRALLEGREAPPAAEGDALAQLRAAARAAAGVSEADTTVVEPRPVEFIGRSRALQALNPEISFTADLFQSIETENADEDNSFSRAFELSLESALDPYTRAKITMTSEDPTGSIEVFPDETAVDEPADAGVVVEEGYLQWVNLPGGLGIKVGRFFQQFGRFNRWHVHALPFQSRSLPHLAFIGDEPLAQDGASVHWLLPTAGSGAYEATFEVTTSRNEDLWGESSKPSYLGHFNSFWQLSASTDLEIGLSAVGGNRVRGDVTSRNLLYGVETAFNWAPPARSLYRSLTLKAGMMRLDPEETVGSGLRPALGMWTLGEFKFARQWIASGRYDWVQNPRNPDETAWIVSPALTYWQSEFVRLGVEYDVLGNPGGTTGQLTLRTTFAMGPHRHETY